MTDRAVEATELVRTYRAAGLAVHGVDGVSLTVDPGEVVAVTGPSGSGKSTLLALLGGLDRPESGTVRITGVAWESLRGKASAAFRRRTCGFVVQGTALLPQATAAENVEVPLLLDGVPAADRVSRVKALLDRVELAADADKLTDQLSGGQQQRAAVARALVMNPAVVLADEPTASLDSANAQSVVRLLVALAREQRAAVVLVTHDPAVAQHADRTVHLRSGRLT